MISDEYKFRYVPGDIAFLSGAIEMAANEYLVEAGDRQEDIIADVFELESGPESFQQSFQSRIQEYLQSFDRFDPAMRAEIDDIIITLEKQETVNISDSIIRAFDWESTKDVKTKVERFISSIRYYLQEPVAVYRLSNRDLYHNRAVTEACYDFMWLDDILIQYPGYMVLLVCASSE